MVPARENDTPWTEVAEFVANLRPAGQIVIAPTQFRSHLTNVFSHDDLDAAEAAGVIVLHKGEIDRLGLDWIAWATTGFCAAFANEVFVVFTRAPGDPAVVDSPHFISFRHMLAAARQQPKQPFPTARRESIYLGNRRALTTTIYGYKLFVDTDDISLAPHLLLDGYWERWVSEVFLRSIKPGMRVVDVGANVGYYSLLAAGLVGPKGHVFAFEANQEFAELIHSSFSVNGFSDRTSVEAKAVYSSTRKLNFGVQRRFKGGSGIYATPAFASRHMDTVKVVKVQAVSLDDYFKRGTHIDVIKIDAEGAEPKILAGAKRLIKENKHIQIFMEYAPSIFAPAKQPSQAFSDLIRTMGFRIYRIEHDGSLVLVEGVAELPDSGHWDVLLKRS